MEPATTRESATLDRLDRCIIQALQINARAGFSLMAQVLGVSEQTVARRYRRLRAEGLVRVIALVSPRHLGQSEWLVRVGCRPGGVAPLAEALARRDDVSWVTLSAGGSEVVCSVRSHTTQQRDDLLLQRLPATSQVLSVAAHAILHRFVGAGSQQEQFYGDYLDSGQAAALRSGAPAPAADPGGQPAELSAADHRLLAALAADGRASYQTLASASGTSVGRVTRRVDTLLRAGVVYFDVDVATGPLGYAATAYLWLTVEPASLAAVGEEIADHPEVPFAAAVSGSANLVATVVCRDTEQLYRYVTTRISAVAGVRQLEISPMLRRIKQAGTWMEGQRLASLPPPPRPSARVVR
jgi:DNA-binding Lrp family transcriptional regulator